MDHAFGYVYVFTNPSMPGHVKLGMTQRRPERRVAELSGATGVPREFELFYYRSFDDCAVAEKVAHSVLDEQGLRVAPNREFFSISPQEAKDLVDKVADSLADSSASAAFGDTFLARAQEILGGPRVLVTELEEALNYLEHSASLGVPLASYLAGETALKLADKRKAKEAVHQALRARARGFFETAGSSGLARGYARAAELSLAEGETQEYVRQWERYLLALPPPAGVPQEEVEFLLTFLFDHMFDGERACPPVHPYLKANSRQLRKFTHANGAPKAFQGWLGDYIATAQERLLEVAAKPLAALGVLFVCWLLKPDWVVIGVILLLLGFGVFAGIRARLRKRREAKETKSSTRGKPRR